MENEPTCTSCKHIATSHGAQDDEIVLGCRECLYEKTRENIFVNKIGRLERGLVKLKAAIRVEIDKDRDK